MNYDQFKRMVPLNKNPEAWFREINKVLEKNELNTINRIAGFMAQCAHESSDFNVVVENLNYPWSGLRKTFSEYYPTDASAKADERQPQKIANKVYANRMGNFKENDGWVFRGHGLIQLTGRDNFTRFGNDVGKSPEEAAEYALTTQGALESAGWYWKINKLNRFCDADDIKGLTKAINGGTNGLDERTRNYERNKKILGENSSTEIFTTLKVGSRGEYVKQLQDALHINNDGKFGPMTSDAVKSWQRSNGFVASGEVDLKQFNLITGKK